MAAPRTEARPRLIVVPIVQGRDRFPTSCDFGLFDQSRPPQDSGYPHFLVGRFADRAEAEKHAALPDLLDACKSAEGAMDNELADGSWEPRYRTFRVALSETRVALRRAGGAA